MIAFGSDNEAPAREEIMQALARANVGRAPSYGEDELTVQLKARFCEVFDTELTSHPLLTGTAANALALSQLVPAYGATLCHEHAHINIHECGAPEFFTGGKLLVVQGEGGKISAATLEQALAGDPGRGYHSNRVTALSITQPTEHGTVYSPDELGALCSIAHGHGLLVHMDGARFANALAHLGCSPAELSWQAGVDVMSFGSSKNGTLNAEAFLAFNPDAATEIQRKLKQSGQLASKMRYVSAQLLAYLEDGNWLRWAAESNLLARELATALGENPHISVRFPVQANILIVRMPRSLEMYLQDQGVAFFSWDEVPGHCRLVLSNLNERADVEGFLQLLSDWQVDSQTC